MSLSGTDEKKRKSDIDEKNEWGTHGSISKSGTGEWISRSGLDGMNIGHRLWIAFAIKKMGCQWNGT